MDPPSGFIKQAQGRRLSGAVRPEQADDRPVGRVETDAPDRIHLAEALANVSNGNHGRTGPV
jgi:hypothetical protein